MITLEQLTGVMRSLKKRPVQAAEYLPHLNAAMEKFGINTPKRIRAFLAQLAVESGELSRFRENMNYSAQRLRQVFGKYYPNQTIANLHAHRQELIANRVYGGRMGNVNPGDGWRFRGAGAIQATGRAMFAAVSRGLGYDFVSDPDALAENLKYVFESAAWIFAVEKGLLDEADNDLFETIGIRINGGRNGMADRFKYWALAKLAIRG